MGYSTEITLPMDPYDAYHKQEYCCTRLHQGPSEARVGCQSRPSRRFRIPDGGQSCRRTLSPDTLPLQTRSPCGSSAQKARAATRQWAPRKARDNAQIAELKADNQSLRERLSRAIVVDQAFVAGLILILVVLPVSIRDIQWVLASILGPMRAPSRSAIAKWVRKFGLLAQFLLMRARRGAAPRVTSLMADEIFFGAPALVAMESSSRAALSVERVQARDA